MRQKLLARRMVAVVLLAGAVAAIGWPATAAVAGARHPQSVASTGPSNVPGTGSEFQCPFC